MSEGKMEYEIGRKLWEVSGVVAFEGTHINSATDFVFKTFPSSDTFHNELNPIWREIQILSSIKSSAFQYGKGYLDHSNNTYGIFSWFDGISLNDYLRFTTIGLTEKLRIFASIANDLDHIHSKNVYLGHFNSDTVRWSAEKERCRFELLGFSETNNLPSIEITHDTNSILYIAPEQSERSAYTTDHRCDFYALGVLIYETITGTKLFPYQDESLIITAHLNEKPIPPSDLANDLPLRLSELTMRLLSKNPAQRYQSGNGIYQDLNMLAGELASNSHSNTPLGRYDVPTQLRFSNRVYGRENETKVLLDALSSNSNDVLAPIFISGESGIGKTSLVEALVQETKRRGAVFVSGKYEQFEQHRPYFGISKALTMLTNHLSTDSEYRQQHRREELKNQLGGNTKILHELVPDIKLLIGKDYIETDQIVEDADKTLGDLTRRYISYVSKEKRLVLFLDDLQWMDEGSEYLLKYLFGHHSLSNALLVCTYRSEEKANNSYLQDLLENLYEKSEHIHLKPLKTKSVQSYLSDIFHKNESEVKELAEALLNKSNGNPFFLSQLLRTQWKKEGVYYCCDSSGWEFDIDSIMQDKIAQNVADLKSHGIDNYSEQALFYLNILACFGGTTTVKTLHTVTGEDIDSIIQHLRLPLTDGMLDAVENADTTDIEYRYAHDKIEHAVYSRMSSDESEKLHMQIGNAILNYRNQFDSTVISSQFDKANILNHIEYNLEAAIVYLESGTKAKTIVAYNTAWKNIDTAEKLSTSSELETPYSFSQQLLREKAEVAYLLGNLDESRKIINLAIQKCRSKEDKADLYTLLILQNTLKGLYGEAIELGTRALSILNFSFPEWDIESEHEKELEILDRYDIETDYEKLLDTPLSEDESHIRIIKILMFLIPPSYFVRPELNHYISTLITRLSFQRGITSASVKGIANYGAIYAEKGRYKTGYQFGRLALDICEKYNLNEYKARVLYLFAGNLNHWVSPLRSSAKIVDEGAILSDKYGDRDYTGYILTLAHCQNQFFSGINLGDYLEELDSHLTLVDATQNSLAQGMAYSTYACIQSLMGITPDNSDSQSKLNGENIVTIATEQGHDLVRCYFYLLQAHNHAHAQNYVEALKYLRKATSLRECMSTEIMFAMLNFYESYILLSCSMHTPDQVSNSDILTIVHENQTQLEEWSTDCPDNFQSLYFLIDGLTNKLNGNENESLRLLVEAERLSRQHHFPQIQALANLALCYHWEELELIGYVEVHATRAIECYKAWGANSLVQRVKTLFGADIEKNLDKAIRRSLDNIPRTLAELEKDREHHYLISATRALGEELDVIKLAYLSSQFITEHLGAIRTGLFSCCQNDIELVSEFSSNSNLESLDAIEEILALIRHVKETNAACQMNVQALPSVFDNAYFSTVVSAACIPLSVHNELEGVLYIESQQPIDDDQINGQFIDAVCSHSAISLRNARLYGDLESQVQRRTNELKALNKNLENKVENQVKEISRLDGLKRFLSPQISSIVINEENDLLASHRREIAIIFCDLRNFTAFSESVEPEEAMEMLTEYHSNLGDLFTKYQATIDHRAGDGLMVFLNDPIPIENPIEEAINLTIEMRDIVKYLISKWNARGHDLGFGIGISYGYSTIGLIGYRENYTYAATGRYVNLASRLCDEAKDGQILITKRAVSDLADSLETEFTSNIALKGFKNLVPVYSLIAIINNKSKN